MAGLAGAQRVVGVAAGCVGLLLESLHLPVNLLEFLQHRLQALRAQSQFLDQADHLHPVAQEPSPGRATLRQRFAAVKGHGEIAAVLALQMVQRAEVRL